MGRKSDPLLNNVEPGSQAEQEQILKNARDMALDKRARITLPDVKAEQSPELQSLLPGQSWAAQAPTWDAAARRNEFKDIVAEQTKLDPTIQGVGRSDVNAELMNALMRMKYPEMTQNMKMTKSLGSEPKDPGLAYDVNAYRRRVIQDLTGQNLRPDQIVPFKDPNNLGVYNPEDDKLYLRNIKDFATPVHEALHRKYEGPGSSNEIPEENLKDLTQSNTLGQDLNSINAGHIPYKGQSGLEGETGFLYDKLQELLKQKK